MCYILFPASTTQGCGLVMLLLPKQYRAGLLSNQISSNYMGSPFRNILLLIRPSRTTVFPIYRKFNKRLSGSLGSCYGIFTPYTLLHNSLTQRKCHHFSFLIAFLLIHFMCISCGMINIVID